MSGRVATRIGWADFGDYEHFGARLHRDLTGTTTLAQLVVFSACGVLPRGDDAAILDDIACAAHVPDPRVWPMKIGRLVATSTRRAIGGALAGLAALAGDALGESTFAATTALVLEAREVRARAPDDATRALAALVASRETMPGFGVQQRAVDERVAALRACITRRGRASLPAWAAFEALAAAAAVAGSAPNIFSASAAALLDAGVPEEAVPTVTAELLAPQFFAHALDGMRTSESARLTSAQIRYVGSLPRESPRAKRP
jgi:hypothetical protein